MRLVQYLDSQGRRAVAATNGSTHVRVRDAVSTHGLVLEAIGAGGRLVDLIEQRLTDEAVDVAVLEGAGRLLAPLEGPIRRTRPTCW